MLWEISRLRLGTEFKSVKKNLRGSQYIGLALLYNPYFLLTTNSFGPHETSGEALGFVHPSIHPSIHLGLHSVPWQCTCNLKTSILLKITPYEHTFLVKLEQALSCMNIRVCPCESS